MIKKTDQEKELERIAKINENWMKRPSQPKPVDQKVASRLNQSHLYKKKEFEFMKKYKSVRG